MLLEVAEPHLQAVLKKPGGNTERPRLQPVQLLESSRREVGWCC